MRVYHLLLVLCLCAASCFAQEKAGPIKDSYYLPYVGAPEYVITVSGMTNQNYREESRTLRDAVAKFAADHHLEACPAETNYVFRSGPPFCDFKDEHVAIQIANEIRIAPYDKKFSLGNFNTLADSLVASLRKVFPERVKVEKRKYLSK